MNSVELLNRVIGSSIRLPAHGPLDGMTLDNWLRLVRKYGLPKLGKKDNLKLAIVACRNSLQALQDNQQALTNNIDPDVSRPLFILGYWRSGTTHLHNLFAVDERFAFPSQFDVNHPRTFLTSTCPRNAVPVRRVQDNVLSSDYSPDEDEYALLAMTSVTPYLSLLYPSRYRQFYRYLTFSEASSTEREAFKTAMQLFNQRLYGSYGKPMVYKSPGHTARVALLLEMFPNARFVHIHRDPVDIYQSKLHLLDSMFGDRITATEKHKLIVDTYASCYESYLKDLPLIPQGSISEVGFDELESKPLESMRRLYNELELPDFSSVEEAINEYLQKQSSYKKNAYSGISSDTRAELQEKWGTQATALGYSI